MRKYTPGMVFVLLLLGCAYVNVSLAPSVRPLEERVIEGRGDAKILLVELSGFISGRDRTKGMLRKIPPMTSRIKEELDKARKDPDMAGVVLRIDTPGGTVTASDIIYHEILEFKKQKGVPVYASIMGLGTSGGYYVASAADRIFAHPTSITGSIGVIAMKFNIQGLMEKLGVKSVAVKSGDKKDIFSPFRPDTPEEKAIAQRMINTLFNRFVEVVAQGRKGVLGKKKILALADGRPYTAKEALAARLIDDIGYISETIDAMKNSLGIKEARVVTYLRPGGYKNNIYSTEETADTGGMVGLDGGAFSFPGGVEFLYLWNP